MYLEIRRTDEGLFRKSIIHCQNQFKVRARSGMIKYFYVPIFFLYTVDDCSGRRGQLEAKVFEAEIFFRFFQTLRIVAKINTHVFASSL